MSAAERITKLTVRSVWPEKSPSPQGEPEFTVQDIALGVAHCNPIGGNILLHKYVFNQVTQAQCPRFYKEVWGMAIDTAIEHQWDDGPKGEMWYRKLAHAALYEILSPVLNCLRCKGAKWIGQRACPSCHATGRTQIDSDERGEALGIPMGAWNHGRPPWRARYEIIYRRLTDLEGLAVGELSHQLLE
jgi:hypothetical protein